MQRLNWNTQQFLWGVIAVCCRNNVYVSSTYNTCNNSLDVLKEWQEVFSHRKACIAFQLR
jgi:hypothetical protein